MLAIKDKDSQGRKCLILWRHLSETANTPLEAWFARNRAHFADSLDLVYVNGDHALNALKQPNESWNAETIEPIFRELMFSGGELQWETRQSRKESKNFEVPCLQRF